MKSLNYLVLTVLLIIPTTCFNGEIKSSKELNSIWLKKIDKAYELAHKTALLLAIAEVESSWVMDTVNHKENAIGLLQIRSIMVDEVNRVSTNGRYKHDDCYNPIKSIRIFLAVQNYYNPELDIKKACMVWNAGSLSKSSEYKVRDYENKVRKKYQYHYEKMVMAYVNDIV